jgi:hypothetical protein
MIVLLLPHGNGAMTVMLENIWYVSTKPVQQNAIEHALQNECYNKQ